MSPISASQVNLIAVSKTQPQAAIIELIEQGQLEFGENKVQEAQEKWTQICLQYPSIKLHLIGSLQTNKVKEALQVFDVIETIDRPSLVDKIAKEIASSNNIVCKEFFIQVNIGEEAQKGGVMPNDLPDLLAYIETNAPNIKITGLMCVPPADKPPAPYFALLNKLANEAGIKNLSMGMSGDYIEAIRLGATHIRVGTALFGERK